MNFSQSLVLNDEEYRWSYSRISKYNDCKYAWLLKYIENIDTEELFFSQYGKFMHTIYAKVLLGEITQKNAPEFLLTNYYKDVNSKAPSDKVFVSYFRSALKAVDEIGDFLEAVSGYEIAGVEQSLEFKIGDKDFVGIIDLLLKDSAGNFIIVDHKSRTLKKRSKSGKLKSDAELDKYFEQLYLYSEAVYQTYGKYPKELWLHCYRNDKDKIIKETVSKDTLAQVVANIEDSINAIKNTDIWTPNCDWFACTNLCECHNECEYYKMI